MPVAHCSPTAAGPDVLIQRAVARDGDPSPGRMKRRHVLQYDGIEYCGLPEEPYQVGRVQRRR